MISPCRVIFGKSSQRGGPARAPCVIPPPRTHSHGERTIILQDPPAVSNFLILAVFVKLFLLPVLSTPALRALCSIINQQQPPARELWVSTAKADMRTDIYCLCDKTSLTPIFFASPLPYRAALLLMRCKPLQQSPWVPVLPARQCQTC